MYMTSRPMLCIQAVICRQSLHFTSEIAQYIFDGILEYSALPLFTDVSFANITQVDLFAVGNYNEIKLLSGSISNDNIISQ